MFHKCMIAVILIGLLVIIVEYIQGNPDAVFITCFIVTMLNYVTYIIGQGGDE